MFPQHLLYTRPWGEKDEKDRTVPSITYILIRRISPLLGLRAHNVVIKFWFYTSASQNREYFPEVTTQSKKPIIKSSLETVTREDL